MIARRPPITPGGGLAHQHDPGDGAPLFLKPPRDLVGEEPAERVAEQEQRRAVVEGRKLLHAQGRISGMERMGSPALPCPGRFAASTA